MIEVWINYGSGWINELIESQYINISTYTPLSGSSYMNLKKFMLNILILQKNIQKELKKLTKNCWRIDYDEIEFPVKEKDFNKIEVKNNIRINVFGYENRLVRPIYVSNQKFKDSMHLLLLIDNDKSHYVYIKDFDRFMFHKTKNKNKKWFCKSCLQCLVMKMYW